MSEPRPYKSGAPEVSYRAVHEADPDKDGGIMNLAMNAGAPTLQVIVPTMAQRSREAELARALGSILEQESVAARPLVVINGQQFEPRIRLELEQRDDLDVHYQESSNLPLAIAAGRNLVVAEYFSFLDDDDFYLPHGLALRLAPMLEDALVDAVISPGLLKNQTGEKRPFQPAMQAGRDNPALALGRFNWLASCGGTFRSSAVETEIFEAVPAYFEWTEIAFRLALAGKNLHFLDEMTFVIEQRDDSLSRSDEACLAAPKLIRRRLDSRLPRSLSDVLKRKYVDAQHCAADRCLRRARKSAARRHHLASLGSVYGFRQYFLFTRKLF